MPVNPYGKENNSNRYDILSKEHDEERKFLQMVMH